MFDAIVRRAGRLLAGALAMGAMVVTIPWLFKQPPADQARPRPVPAAIHTTQPTVLHAVEGFDGTPSPLSNGQVTPATIKQTATDENFNSAALTLPGADEDLRR